MKAFTRILILAAVALIPLVSAAESNPVTDPVAAFFSKKNYSKCSYNDLMKLHEKSAPGMAQAFDARFGASDLNETLKVDSIVAVTYENMPLGDLRSELMLYRTVNLSDAIAKQKPEFKKEFEAWMNLMSLLHQFYSGQTAIIEYGCEQTPEALNAPLQGLLQARIQDLKEILYGITSNPMKGLTGARVDFLNTLSHAHCGDVRNIEQKQRVKFSEQQKELRKLQPKIEVALEKWLAVRRTSGLAEKNTAALIIAFTNLEAGKRNGK